MAVQRLTRSATSACLKDLLRPALPMSSEPADSGSGYLSSLILASG